MKLVAISDLHLDAFTMGQPRFHEVAMVLHKAAAHAIREKVDLFLCTGDISDPDSGPVVLRAAREIVTVAEDLRRAGVPSAWVCGNHDVDGDGQTTTLDPLLGLDLEWVHVCCGAPSTFGFGREWVLAGLPYPMGAKGWGSSHAPIARTRKANEGKRILVAGHLSIDGVVPGEESSELARGKDVFWPKSDVEGMKPDIKLGGHYHRRHVTEDGIQIIGSAVALTFGEKRQKGEEPGYVVIEHGEVGTDLRVVS